MPNRFTSRRLVAIVTALGMIGADAAVDDVATAQLKSFVWTKDDCVTEDAEVDASGQQAVFLGTPGFKGNATFVCVGGADLQWDDCEIGEGGKACSIAGAFDASACHGITVTLTPLGATPAPSSTSTAPDGSSTTTSTTTAGEGVTTTTGEGVTTTTTTTDPGEEGTGSTTTEEAISGQSGDDLRRLSATMTEVTTVTYCFGESSEEASGCSASAEGTVNIGQPKEDHIQETFDGSSQDWTELTDCPASDGSDKPSEPQSGSVAAKISAASVLLSLIAAV